MSKKLFYGDNLDVLRKHIASESVDVCYIDPPFNSKRNYYQIYNNIGEEDKALAQSFIDTWTWDDKAMSGFSEIIANDSGRFQPKTVELLKGLRMVLGEGSLLAYIVSIALRITEIHRVLKPNGSFFLHCDPTASHYLKILVDGIFCSTPGGDFRNEIIWYYKTGGMSKRWFGKKHDVVFFYVKGKDYTFNPKKEKSYLSHKYGFKNVEIFEDEGGYYTEVGMRDVWDIPALRGNQPETQGYPTQKPLALLTRILQATTTPDSVVLDAYCGCGTTVVAAEQLGLNWIGIDITYQSISLVLKRLEEMFGAAATEGIVQSGIPKDTASAAALANKKDDRLRKEFEKWAILTFTNNRAIVNDKKGADGGVDGIAYFLVGKVENAKIIFQVKSGGVGRGDIAKLRGDMEKTGAAMAYFITLEEPTKPMIAEAKLSGIFEHQQMGRSYERMNIVTVREIVEQQRRLDIPMSLEVLRTAQKAMVEQQGELPL
jgi:site-specific DNA-methyltransferase (adenine-specific)